MAEYDSEYSFLKPPTCSAALRYLPLGASLTALLISLGMCASATSAWREDHQLKVARRAALESENHLADREQAQISNSLETQALMREKGEYSFSQVIVGGYIYVPGVAPPPNAYVNFVNPHHPTMLFDLTGKCIGIFHKQRLFFIDDQPGICQLSVSEVHDKY